MQVKVDLPDNTEMGIALPQQAEMDEIIFKIKEDRIISKSNRYFCNTDRTELIVLDKDKPFKTVSLEINNRDKTNLDNPNGPVITEAEYYTEDLQVTPATYDEEGNILTPEIEYNPNYPNVIGQMTGMKNMSVIDLMAMNDPTIINYLESLGVDMNRMRGFKFYDMMLGLNSRLMYEAALNRKKFDK